MIKQMSISETRRRMTSLESDMSYEDTISVTNHGKVFPARFPDHNLPLHSAIVCRRK